MTTSRWPSRQRPRSQVALIPTLDRSEARRGLGCVTTPGSRRSCPGWGAAHHLNIDRFHQPCLLPGVPSCCQRTVVPAARGDHFPLRAARSSLLCVPLEVLTTTTRRYHDRPLIRPFLPACATPHHKGVCTHAGSDPRGSAAACWRHALEPPSPSPPSWC